MVHATELPPDSLIGHCAASGAYVDCYVTQVAGAVTHQQFVEAFYTTPLFKLERVLLAVFLSRPSTDAQARQLADGQSASFAAWSVEARAEDQLVLAAGRTRSWLRVAAGPGPLGATTQLFFGSVVLPRRSASGAAAGMGPGFSALLGFHRLYARALLRAASRRLSARMGDAAGSHRGGA